MYVHVRWRKITKMLVCLWKCSSAMLDSQLWKSSSHDVRIHCRCVHIWYIWVWEWHAVRSLQRLCQVRFCWGYMQWCGFSHPTQSLVFMWYGVFLWWWWGWWCNTFKHWCWRFIVTRRQFLFWLNSTQWDIKPNNPLHWLCTDAFHTISLSALCNNTYCILITIIIMDGLIHHRVLNCSHSGRWMTTNDDTVESH